MRDTGLVSGFWLRRGVRDRAVITAVAVVAVALLVGGFVLIGVLNAALTDSVRASVVQRAQDVAAQITADDIDAAAPTINAAPGDATVIQVVTADGRVVLSSPSIKGESAIPAAGGTSGDPSISQMPMPFADNDPYLVASVSAATTDGSVTVVSAQSLVQVESVTGIVTKWLLVGAPLLLATVGAVTWVAVGRSLRSVDRIRARVDTIDARQFDERVPVPVARDELARLAVTMNHMLDRLQASAMTQRQFVADASHELKSPLASMRASLDVAGSIGGTSGWIDAEPVLNDEVDRMTHLVSDLLLLAKADEGALRPSLVEVDLDDLVASEVARLRGQSPLTVTALVEPTRVLADPDRLAQALRNVVDNAVRFAHGQVRLNTYAICGTAIVSVDDDGPGIPEASRDAVVRRFVRLDEHRSRDQGGAGLGLAIASEIMRIHGGRLVVDASELGGAQIRLELPVGSAGPKTGSSR